MAAEVRKRAQPEFLPPFNIHVTDGGSSPVPTVNHIAEPKMPPLTKRQLAELRRRHADMIDPTRHVIVSPFTNRFCLYYCPADGNFVMNEITDASMFKRRSEALAVARLVHGRRGKRRRRTLQVITVRKTKRGVRILDEVVDPWNPKKRWRPVLRRKDPKT